jgi:predicted nucleic acid-binding protein
MIKKHFLDTGIVTRHLLGKIKIPQEILSDVCISIITKIELYNWLSNYRNADKLQRVALLKTIKNYPVAHVNIDISKEAEQFADNHRNTKPNDTLIGFTVKHYDGTLHTGDKDDFNQIGIKIIYYPQKKFRKK